MHFVYDGQSSKKFGVYMAQIGGGLYNESFLPNRKITEKRIANREKPYFQGIESDPLQFQMTIVIHEWDIVDNKRQIARWLFQDYYKPLYFESNPERIYYAIIDGNSQLFHNGITTYNDAHAYINVNVRCDSPYAYTPEYPLPSIKFRGDNKEKVFEDKGTDLANGSYDNAVLVNNNKVQIEEELFKWSNFYLKYINWGDID